MNTFIRNICEAIINTLVQAIINKNFSTLVLSGGNTPKFIFKELILNYKDKIDWKKVHIFWLDERCVQASHPDSNYKLADDYLLKYIDVGSTHRIKGEIDPDIVAEEYTNEIKSFFKLEDGEIPRFDLILLGMGEDGHCASLFPKSKELEDKKNLVVATEKVYNKHRRVTLTLPVINNSHSVLMINSQKKLDVFQDKKKVLPIHMVSINNIKVIVQI